MSEIHAVNPEKVVKEILDHVWCNLRETFAVKDKGIVNVDTVHADGSVDNDNSVTSVQTDFENSSQTPVRDSVVASMKENLATSPQTQKYQGLIIFPPSLGLLCTVSQKERDLRVRTDLLHQNPLTESILKAACITLSPPNQ